jgi:BolA protein
MIGEPDEPRVGRMRHALVAALAPAKLLIRDDSAQHAGHAGARGGAGHYHVSIASERFRGLAPLARHRLVYEALDGLMGSEIHALSIDTELPP